MMLQRLIWLLGLWLCPLGMAVRAGDELAKEFAAPPAEAKPWVYWFVSNGNLTAEGITKDFESMARVGIGGLLFMEVDQGVPAGDVAFGSPRWMELMKHAFNEAKRLDLEVTMNNDAGWTGSGGPWITPELSMQKPVWSEVVIEGGRRWTVELPQPAAVQDFYRDIAVLAMPAPAGEQRVPDAHRKAVFAPGHTPPLPATFTEASEDSVIPLADIIDLTGKKVWDVPPGRWLVMRFGHTTTGKTNHPAPASGLGLECDKMSKEAIGVHYRNLIGKLVEQNRALTGSDKVFVSTHIDSWEVELQNWTARMPEKFKALRGYDILPYLPAFAGYILDSMEVTERFLWDLRLTVSDLIIENYAVELRRLANADGLTLSIEPLSWDNHAPLDEMAYGGQADMPMPEFWLWPAGGWPRFYTANSMPGTVSAAHTYGRRIIPAEAFTSSDAEKWKSHPGNMKIMGDWAFSEGINRFVFHRFAAQPWGDRVAPGMAMGAWGVHYERTQTWWELTKPYHDYLTRCQHLLRQGLFVADILYLQAEGSPRRFDRPPETELATDIRDGYNFDGCSPDVIMNRAKVKDGRIVLPDGMSYRVLVLPDTQTMTLGLLKKIKELHEAGATIIAGNNPPQKSPSLSDMKTGDAEVERIAAELWPMLITGKRPAQYLEEQGIPRDFSATTHLRYIHRADKGVNLYFVANPEERPVEATASFRVTGKQPELWHPETGRIKPIRVFSESDGRTHIPLTFDAAESVFVVFRDRPAKETERIVSLKRDGEELLKTSASGKPQADAEPAGTFTITAWVKPETEITMPAEAATGITAAHVERNDAVYAAPGHEVWKGNTVGAGFGVGKNGIGVFEHGDYHFAPVLVHPVPITDWTHVTVVYQNGEPSLYLDGSFVKKGLKSNRPVHSSVGAVHGREIKAFNGRVSSMAHFPAALSADEIRKTAAEKPSTQDPAPQMPLDPVDPVIYQNGVYETATADGKTKPITVKGLPAPLSIAGPWNVSFAPNRGAPAKIVMDELISWSTHEDEGIRHFSGEAVYRKRFKYSSELSPELAKSARVYLDLGKIHVMASVKVNGKDVGIAWKAPQRLDITDAVQQGDNTLEIKVVNTWINRMIGDESLPEDSPRQGDGTLKEWPAWLNEGKPSPTGRHTFTTWRLWKKGDALVDSGLLGPVVIQTGVRLEP
jgi:hypothetical protein